MKIITWLSLVLCCFTVSALGAEPANGYRSMGAEEFAKLRLDTNNVVLDVRSEAEFHSGHLLGAINIDWNGEEFARKVAELNKRKTYLVYCASGMRSARACAKMSQLGFIHLNSLQGGIRAWQKAGQPIQK